MLIKWFTTFYYSLNVFFLSFNSLRMQTAYRHSPLKNPFRSTASSDAAAATVICSGKMYWAELLYAHEISWVRPWLQLADDSLFSKTTLYSGRSLVFVLLTGDYFHCAYRAFLAFLMTADGDWLTWIPTEIPAVTQWDTKFISGMEVNNCRIQNEAAVTCEEMEE